MIVQKPNFGMPWKFPAKVKSHVDFCGCLELRSYITENSSHNTCSSLVFRRCVSRLERCSLICDRCLY